MIRNRVTAAAVTLKSTCILLALLTCPGSTTDARAFSRMDLTENLPVRVQPFGAYGTNRFKVVTQFAPASFQRRFTMPPQAVLRTAVAIPGRLWTTDLREKLRPTLLRITWRSGPRSFILFERLVDARRRGDQRWLEVAADLSSHAGERGILVFSAKPAGGSGGFVVLWDSPEIVSLTPPVPPGVILIVVDALRADHLGSYGYGRPTSRYLDRLARDSLLFLKAFSSAPKTIPSVPQLLTSSYFPDQLPAASILETIRRAGLSPSRAIVNNPHVDSWLQQNSSGLGVLMAGEPNARVIGRRALEWMKESRGVPFFLLLHYLDTHTPYQPPRAFAERFIDGEYRGPVGLSFSDVAGAWQGRYVRRDQKHIGNLYDGAIRYADHHIGRLLEGLKRLGIYDDTIIVVTADHGEELWDHGRFFHGQSLYDELMHVPLIIKLPRQRRAGERISSLVRLVDVAPTLYDLVAKSSGGEDSPTWRDGKSLLPLLEGREQESRTAFATVSRGEPNAPPRQAIRTDRYKYILTLSTGGEELYDLESDPLEKHNLAPAAPDLTASLLFEITRTVAPLSSMGYRIEISNRGVAPVSYQVRLATDPAAPFVEVNRLGLEKGDIISVGRHSDGFTLAGKLLPGDRDSTRFDILAADAECRVVARVDGRMLPAQAIRLGNKGRPPEALPARVPISAPYLQGPAYMLGLGEGETVELAFWRESRAAGKTTAPKLSADMKERLNALGYAQ